MGIIVVILLIAAFFYLFKQDKGADKNSTKTCGYCGNTISFTKSVCPFCKHKVSAFGTGKENMSYLMSGSIGVIFKLFGAIIVFCIIAAVVTGGVNLPSGEEGFFHDLSETMKGILGN